MSLIQNCMMPRKIITSLSGIVLLLGLFLAAASFHIAGSEMMESDILSQKACMPLTKNAEEFTFFVQTSDLNKYQPKDLSKFLLPWGTYNAGCIFSSSEVRASLNLNFMTIPDNIPLRLLT